jgi:hypothetical protein
MIHSFQSKFRLSDGLISHVSLHPHIHIDTVVYRIPVMFSGERHTVITAVILRNFNLSFTCHTVAGLLPYYLCELPRYIRTQLAPLM